MTRAMATATTATVTDRLLAGIEAGAIAADTFGDAAVLDATVPNWRFSVHGGPAVREQLGGWYRVPGRFEALRRTPLPDGELVEFTLTWPEQGTRYTCHQVHILTVADDRVTRDTVFCGGRWPPALVADMALTLDPAQDHEQIGAPR